MIDGFYPTELLPLMPMDKAVSAITDHADRHFKTSSIFCAAGPFALVKKSDDGSYHMNYAPLASLFEYIGGAKHGSSSPVLLLLGPFVDADSVASMATSVIASEFHSFEEMFREEISRRIGGLLSLKTKMKVILIPSSSDIIHDHVFPQAALPRDVLSIPTVFARPLTTRMSFYCQTPAFFVSMSW